MKRVISWVNWAAVALLASAPALAEDGLRWEADLPSAQRLARQTNRLVLIHFGGPWCPPCQLLEQRVFSQPGFGRELTADYVAVKVDPNSSVQNHEIAKQYQVERVPADVITTPGGQLIYHIASPNTAAGYVSALTQAAAQARPERQSVPQQAQPAGPPPTQVAAQPAGDRYADYYNRGQGVAREPYQPPVQHRGGPVPPSPETNRSAQRQAEPQRQALASVAPSAVAQSPAAEVSAGARSSASEAASGDDQPIELQIPPGSPPLALEGFCPVTLVEPGTRCWQMGDPKVGAIHRGMLYLFASVENQQKFLANPDHYSPVLRGHDPVLALDKNQAVPGRREFGVFCDGRIYLFASEATRAHFERNSKRYSADILQAMR